MADNNNQADPQENLGDPANPNQEVNPGNPAVNPPPPPPAPIDPQVLAAAIQNAVQQALQAIPGIAAGPNAGGPAPGAVGPAAGGLGALPGGIAPAQVLLQGNQLPGNPEGPAAAAAAAGQPPQQAALLRRIDEGPRPRPLTAAQQVDQLIGARAPVRDPAFPADAVPHAIAPRGVAKVQPYEEVDTTTWTEWKTNWLRMARIYQWDDLTQIDTIKNYFRGEALRRVVGVFPAPGDNILDYIQKLEHVLVPASSSSEARSEYHSLAQLPKEAAVAYRGRAVLLFRRAYPERSVETDTEFLFRFVQGIWADPVRRNLLLNFPANLTEAYEKMANAGQFITELQNDKARSALHSTKASIQAIGAGNSGRYNSPTGNRRTPDDIREEDRRKNQCFNCHKTGHSVSNCSLRPRNEQSGRSYNQNNNQNYNQGQNRYRRNVGAIDEAEEGDRDDRDQYPDDDPDDDDEASASVGNSSPADETQAGN